MPDTPQTGSVSIHSEHPFSTAGPDRDPLRRLRGRMPSPVSVWTAGAGGGRVGWTLSSFLVADGQPAEVIGLLDEDSDLADALTAAPAPAGGGATLVVNLLGWAHRGLADAFAGVAPAPGGVFKLGGWTESAWGPVLADAPAWLGARVTGPPEHAGWALLVRAEVEHVELGPEPDAGMLTYARGRYRPVS
jgi:flavin reductase (DIM6/NTAB) family NADH-FMN oxidoreductase RutF